MYTIFLCDDNHIILKKYTELLDSIAKKNHIPVQITAFSSAEELLYHLHEVPSFPDMIYLDIFMGKLNGIDLAKYLRKNNCNSQIIFLTGSADYVFDAFDTLPFHYILKANTTVRRFEEIFISAIDTIQEQKEDLLIIESKTKIEKIPLHQIDYFEVSHRLVLIHYAQNRICSFHSSLDLLEKKLFDKGFIRCHRAYLVNLEHVKVFNSKKIILTSDTTLPIGTTYSKRLRLYFHTRLF